MSIATCSICGIQTTIGKKFCAECGATLPRICPACGHPVTAAQKFCDECGIPLEAIAPPSAATSRAVPSQVTLAARLTPATETPMLPEHERRLVTILFADLVGSTSLGEALDLDDMYELIDHIHHHIEKLALRYGGHVARHLGDGLMALFGAPTAHEDDAERAVLAGLDMQRALADLKIENQTVRGSLGMRVGITSGEVVAGTMAGIYDVIGDAPNVAARLQGAAEVGVVLVGEETMRLARRRIRFGERRELTLKGKAEPVTAYVAVGLREQLGERWEEDTRAGYATPLVGRERELEMVLTAWARAQTGEGQLLTVIGEPGIGKSRLLAEVMDRIQGDQDSCILRGRCLSYGQSVSLWLVADLLRSLCAVPEDAGLETVQERITAAVAKVLADCDETDQGIARDVLGEVLGLPPGGSLVAAAGPQIRHSSLIRTFGLVLGSLSETGHLLVVLEDLHWLDAASQEILEALVTGVQGRRILVLATQRPSWTAPWSDWDWTERLALRPLPDDEASVLAGAALGGARLSLQLEDHLRERAEGNPFFVEELVRYLQETQALEEREGEMQLLPGVAERLPATLTEVLLARLDRLESQVKGVAQVGSVIGRSFAVRLLSRVMEREEAILEGPLRALQRAEIAFPRGGEDPEYIFKHVTLRDVAYGMLVRRRQRQLHLAVGRAIAQLYPSDEYVELIAYHYARTEEDAEAAEWLERAGVRARETYANEAAIAHYQGTRERLARCGADAGKRAGIEEKLGEVFIRVSRYEEAQAVLEQAVERYQQAGEVEGMGRAAALLGRVLKRRGDPEEARRQLEGVASQLEGHGPSVASVQVQLSLANVFQGLGQYEEMLRAAERAEALARAIGNEGLRGWAEERKGTALCFLGRIEESRQALEEAIQVAEVAGELYDMEVALANLAWNRELAGALAAAIHLSGRFLELSRRTGFVDDQVNSHINLGAHLMIIGDWRQAREHFARAEDIAAMRGTAAPTASSLPLHLGELALQVGDWEEAARQLNRAIQLAEGAAPDTLVQAQILLATVQILEGRAGEARDRMASWVDQAGNHLPALLLIVAWAQIELGETEWGLVLAEQAERAARERRMPLFLPKVLRIRGMALARLGRTREAGMALSEGRDRAAAMPYPYAQACILIELGLLDRQEGEGQRAREQLEEALAIFQRLGARKDIERTEQALEELGHRHK